MLIPAGAVYSRPSDAQNTASQSQVVVSTNVDGKFAHYIESPNGDIGGIVLEDGTVARFVPFSRTRRIARFDPGDFVRVHGDVVNGLTGQYLVHASATRIYVPTTRRADLPAPPVRRASAPDRSRHAGESAKATPKNARLLPRSAGKPCPPATQGSRRLDRLLVAGIPSTPAPRKGRLEIIESKARGATTGKARSDDGSQSGRSEETEGP